VQLATDDTLYLQATAACFGAIVIMQVVNLFVCRHPVESAFVRRRPVNRLLFAGIAFEIALAAVIIYTPAGQSVFGTAAVAPEVWLFVLPFALAMLGLEEARKAWVRRRA
jgi:magnesium-transporting ATPase (P-type)